jgi:hypothetical protein
MLLAILVTTSESCTFDFCSDDFDKLKKIYGNNYFLEYHSPGKSHASKIRRLTSGCASSTTSSCLRFPKSILMLLALQGCYSSFVVVFNHMTMMPCRNLRPHVRCSHMIEPLGAHWCLGVCDVTHSTSFYATLLVS